MVFQFRVVRNGGVGWVLGGFGGSVWVMGEWAVGQQWIVGVMNFHKMFGIQSGASSLAKHGGAYFSAVYGSIQDPIAAPGLFDIQVP